MVLYNNFNFLCMYKYKYISLELISVVWCRVRVCVGCVLTNGVEITAVYPGLEQLDKPVPRTTAAVTARHFF